MTLRDRIAHCGEETSHSVVNNSCSRASHRGAVQGVPPHMRKLLLAGFVAGSLIAGAGFANAASRSGSTERKDNQTLNCPAPGQQVPANQEAPGPGECTNDQTTYTGSRWDNDVTCSNGQVRQQGITVAAGGSPTSSGWGEAEVCNDGTTSPVQGRALVGGSFEEEGVHASADGDKDNAEQGQGWATAGANTDGPYTTCGDDDGRLDSTQPTAADSSEDCPTEDGTIPLP